VKLVNDWRQAWRFFSIWAAGALAVVSVLQAQVLPLIEFAVPPEAWPWVTACFGVLIVVLRLIAQDAPKEPSCV
jgi:hypothetical protein